MRFATVAFLIMMVGLCEAAAQDRDTALAGALVQWGRKFPGVDSGRPSVVFLVPVNQCKGCGAAAVNQALEKINSLPLNILVVIATDIPREGVAMKRNFRTSHVVEDSPQRLKRLLNFGGSAPELVVISDGEIMFHQEDIQRDAVDIEAVRRAVSGAGSKVVDRTATGVQLQEDDDNVVSGVMSPKVAGDMVVFVDPGQETLCKFNLSTGRREWIMQIPDAIGAHFRDRADKAWDIVIRNYSPLARIDDVVRVWSDSVEVLVKMFTGYTLETLPNGKQGAGFNTAQALLMLRIVGDSDSMELLSLRMIQSGPYVPVPPMLMVGPSFYVTGVISERALEDSTVVSDSTFTMLAICGDSLRGVPVVSVEEIEKISGHRVAVTGIRYLASVGSMVYSFDAGTGAFMMGRAECAGVAFTPVEIGGVTAAMHKGAVLNGAIDTTTISTFLVGGVVPSGRSAFVLASGVDTAKGISYIVVQDYQSGHYAGEVIYRYAVGDDVVDMTPVHCDGREVIALVKWREKRWTIERFPVQ